MKTLLSLFLFMNIISSCQQGEKPLAAKNDTSAKTLLNVAYGKDSLQVMDIYLPKDRSVQTTKALILLHGGGWNSGSKAEFSTYIDSFKKRLPDYAIFNLNYRLVDGTVLFPALEEDVKAALQFIASEAENAGINKDKLVLLGVSAGAHLALLQAYKNPSPKIAAVVDYFGPSDLQTMYNKPWHPLVPLALQMITGTTPQQNPAFYKAASPVEFITPQSPPTLLLHGGRDEIVDLSQSKLLAAKLNAAGVPHHLQVYPQERHGRWYGQALTNSFDQIEKFLRQHVP